MNQPPRSLLKLVCQPAPWLVLILLLGTGLRFYNLGADSLWLDEAGVAYAARAATLGEMLQVVRSHVMAMPLDYLIVWLVGRFSVDEAALRIPAAVWGSLSLLAAYRLYRRFVPPLAALLGLLVLALTPLHIQYSQELRFYSALVFFSLLSTLLLWDAFQQPNARRWAVFTAVTVIGIYFHTYVLFALANGLVWLVLDPRRGVPARSLRNSFILSATLCLLAFLGGYLYFSASNFFTIPLMVFEQSPLGAIAIGLGWLPFSSGPPGLSWLWGLLCAALEITGVGIALRLNTRSPLAGLFYSLLLQFAAVLASDLLEHYFFAPRQLLMLLPVLGLFAGLGAAQFVTARKKSAALAPRAAAAALLVLVILLASLPAIQLYEKDDKGSTRAISQQILSQWQPGDSILIYPAFDGFVYKYYIEYALARPEAIERLFGVEWADLLETRGWSGNVFVITPAQISSGEADQLRSLGLDPLSSSSPHSRYAKTLWVRAAPQP